MQPVPDANSHGSLLPDGNTASSVQFLEFKESKNPIGSSLSSLDTKTKLHLREEVKEELQKPQPDLVKLSKLLIKRKEI